MYTGFEGKPYIGTLQSRYQVMDTFIVFYTVQCELPSTLSGEVLNYTSITEGSLVIHHCEQGLLPTEPTIAVCTADGVWDPDLDQVKCMAPGQPPGKHWFTPFSSILLYFYMHKKKVIPGISKQAHSCMHYRRLGLEYTCSNTYRF